MLEEILAKKNLTRAFTQVVSKGGSAGIDGMETESLEAYVKTHYKVLKEEILSGTYRPLAVREVEIPKPQGGKRKLGIPTVKDRMIQQGIGQWLSPKYEGTFSRYSYGFRPGRSAHQAVAQAVHYLNEGRTWVVELDLEKFFDTVNHDRLMSKLEKVIKDKATLSLIRKYLTGGIMSCGKLSLRKEGVPQGSPLSPLLSNIVLDDLDKELEKRGHCFVRYADDCSIYVRSEKAAHRVCASITKYIEEELRLKVNQTKTKISRPSESTLLGFSFFEKEGKWEIKIAEQSIERITAKCKKLTQRSDGRSWGSKVGRLTPVIRGWVNYFRIGKNSKSVMKNLDGRIRTRLRMCIWKEWKRIRTRIRELRKLGAKENSIRWGSSSKQSCRVANSQILKTTLTNRYFLLNGYKGFSLVYDGTPDSLPSLF